MAAYKISWHGEVLGVQPRIRLMRAYDERNHGYMGYVLFLRGEADGRASDFTVGIGPAAQAKHAFRAGDRVQGMAVAVADARLEPVDFYKASGLAWLSRAADTQIAPEAVAEHGPPWLGVTPELPVYRARGHRRLDAGAWQSTCRNCIWGCRMPVEIMADRREPKDLSYRFETFCYGPKSCALYVAGETRKVQGPDGDEWEETDAVDDAAVAHRGADE
jgi:hypothetical protein